MVFESMLCACTTGTGGTGVHRSPTHRVLSPSLLLTYDSLCAETSRWMSDENRVFLLSEAAGNICLVRPPLFRGFRLLSARIARPRKKAPNIGTLLRLCASSLLLTKHLCVILLLLLPTHRYCYYIGGTVRWAHLKHALHLFIPTRVLAPGLPAPNIAYRRKGWI